MGFVDKTPEGRYRAYFRDPSGKQRSKTFRIKKDATAFLAEMETSKTRGAYVSPHAGRTLFGDHAEKWMAAWNTEITTAARDLSVMRTHVLPQWSRVPLGKIDDLGLQAWVTELGKRRSRATVAEAADHGGPALRGAQPPDPVQPRRRDPGPANPYPRHRRADHQPRRPPWPATARRPAATPRDRRHRGRRRAAMG
jgi:hypothetical protein